MSATRIVVVEEVCQHGNVKCWELLNPEAPLGAEGEWCESGSRRVLPEEQYVLIEKTDGEWPTEAINSIVLTHARMHREDPGDWLWSDFLDSLSEESSDA